MKAQQARDMLMRATEIVGVCQLGAGTVRAHMRADAWIWDMGYNGITHRSEFLDDAIEWCEQVPWRELAVAETPSKREVFFGRMKATLRGAA